nr:hypothetical protein [Tanacetum cinerariifolium]
KPHNESSTKIPEGSGNSNPTASSSNPPADQIETLTVESPIPTVSSPVPTACLNDSPEPFSEARFISKRVVNQEESPSLDNILSLTNRFEDILGVTTSSNEAIGVEADEELLQFKIQNVWTLVDCPKGARPIWTKWVLKNKKDERGIVVRNKARLVAQGHTQEEGIDYDEVFAPVARIEAIRLFLAYASFMGFTVYQMDVKSAFFYGTIDEEVYVMQPPGFQDPTFPAKVYKVEKAMYGLHQAPRAWTLIEEARTMLANAKLPVTFWAEAVNTACYVQNRVLVNKSQNKTPYELFNGRTPVIGFLKPFGCHVMILNTLDHLGKFEAKEDKGYFIGYKGYCKSRCEERCVFVKIIALPNWFHEAHLESSTSNAQDACKADAPESSGNSIPTATPTNLPADQMETLTVETPIPTVSSPVQTACLDDSPQLSSDTRLISKRVTSQDDTPSLDNILTLTNMLEDILGVTTNTGVRPIGTKWVLRKKKDERGIVIRNKARLVAQGLTQEEGYDYEEVFAPVARIEAIRLFLAYASFMGFIVYQMDVKSAFLYGTIDEEVYVMQPPGCQISKYSHRQGESLEKRQNWHQVTPKECHLYVVKRIFRYLKGHPKLGIWYPKDSPFDLVAYSDSDYDGATQDKKSTTGGWVRPIGTKWVLKKKKDERGIVIRNKARLVAQGHTQEEGIDYEEVFAPVARIEAIRLFLAYASFMGFIVYQMDVKSAFLYGTIDEEVYKKDGIFLSQDKYVGDILKKFGYSDVRSANTPMDKENPWRKDKIGKDVDLHLYRSMIGSLMYLTASRPDIMFAVCACARHQVTPKECHLHAVKRIFRYLKGHHKLGIWYPKDSPFDLVAYSDSDYDGATQDKKSTTGRRQFLGRKLISWQCKKQTIVATSTTEAEYVAASSGYDNVADLLTKPFDAGRFQYLVVSIGMLNP